MKNSSKIDQIFIMIRLFAAQFSPFYSAINERMRKRRAFADQDLLETTLTNYYLQVSPPYCAINYSSIEAASKHVKIETETQTRPKISFSIESIIGIK